MIEIKSGFSDKVARLEAIYALSLSGGHVVRNLNDIRRRIDEKD